MKKAILISSLLLLSACLRGRMEPPEIQLVEQTVAMKNEASPAEFCKFISSVVNHQRHVLGRLYVSSPPLVSLYARDCLKQGMLEQKVFLFNVPITEKNLLYRSAICGEPQAVAEVQSSEDPNFKPRFAPVRKGERYYLDNTRPFSTPSD